MPRLVEPPEDLFIKLIDNLKAARIAGGQVRNVEVSQEYDLPSGLYHLREIPVVGTRLRFVAEIWMPPEATWSPKL